MLQICITLYIFFNTVKAQTCTHWKLFNFWYIHIWHIFAKFHACRWLCSKFMAILGWRVARRIKLFVIKILENEIRYKIKRFASLWLKFWHKTHFYSKNIFKKLNVKNFQFWTPHEEKLKFSPISPIFGQNFPNRDLLILLTIETFWLIKYAHVAHFGKASWL